MAISSATYAQSSFRLAIAQEAAFGSAIGTQTAFQELDIITPAQPDMASGVVEDTRKRADGSRIMAEKDTYRITVGGLYVIPFECIVTQETMDYFLYGVMQDWVSTTKVDTKYNNIFEWDNATTGPDFIADEGKLFTVIGYDPSQDWMAKSCILRNVTFSASPGTNGGRLTASGEFVTGFDIDLAPATAADPSSWISPGVGYYPFQTYSACTIDAADLVPYSFSLTMSNGAVRVGHDADGNTQTYYMDEFELSAEIVAKLDANTVALDAKYRANPTAGAADGALIMSWGTVDSIGGLEFVMNAIYTAPNTRDFGQESGVGVTLSYSGRYTGVTKAITVKQTTIADREWDA